MVDTQGQTASVSCTWGAGIGIGAKWNSIGGDKRQAFLCNPRPLTRRPSGSPKTRSAPEPISALSSSTSLNVAKVRSSAPIFVLSSRGSPMVTLAQASVRAASSHPHGVGGTMNRGDGGAFLPRLAVTSRWTLFDEQVKLRRAGAPHPDPTQRHWRNYLAQTRTGQSVRPPQVLAQFQGRFGCHPVKLTTS